MTAALVAIIVAVLEAVVSGLFGLYRGSSKSEAAAAKRETAAVLDVVDSEKAIRDAGKEVERAGLSYEDVFVPRLDNVPL